VMEYAMGGCRGLIVIPEGVRREGMEKLSC